MVHWCVETFRNSLQPLALILDLLESRMQTDTEASEMLKLVKSSVMQIEVVLQAQSKSLYGNQSIVGRSYRWIGKKEVFEDIEPYIQAYSSDKLTFLCEVPEDSSFLCIPKIFSSLLLNLLSNSCKYCLEGNINVLVTLTKITPLHGSITLRISDTGPRLPASVKAFLEQSDNKVPNSNDIQGTGIGIHQIRSAAKLLHASVQISRSKGKNNIQIRFNGAIRNRARESWLPIGSNSSPSAGIRLLVVSFSNSIQTVS
mmetsp:Transcript_2390/g.4467  ORF Transcript_2390/g.4467 Transcript_2390/m.4467 type:complete len:257 (+) Transcript_2390:102-872(+)